MDRKRNRQRDRQDYYGNNVLCAIVHRAVCHINYYIIADNNKQATMTIKCCKMSYQSIMVALS